MRNSIQNEADQPNGLFNGRYPGSFSDLEAALVSAGVPAFLLPTLDRPGETEGERQSDGARADRHLENACEPADQGRERGVEDDHQAVQRMEQPANERTPHSHRQGANQGAERERRASSLEVVQPAEETTSVHRQLRHAVRHRLKGRVREDERAGGHRFLPVAEETGKAGQHQPVDRPQLLDAARLFAQRYRGGHGVQLEILLSVLLENSLFKCLNSNWNRLSV